MTPLEHAPPDFLAWVATLVHRHRDELLRYARRRGLAAEDALDKTHSRASSARTTPRPSW